MRRAANSLGVLVLTLATLAGASACGSVSDDAAEQSGTGADSSASGGAQESSSGGTSGGSDASGGQDGSGSGGSSAGAGGDPGAGGAASGGQGGAFPDGTGGEPENTGGVTASGGEHGTGGETGTGGESGTNVIASCVRTNPSPSSYCIEFFGEGAAEYAEEVCVPDPEVSGDHPMLVFDETCHRTEDDLACEFEKEGGIVVRDMFLPDAGKLTEVGEELCVQRGGTWIEI